MNREEALWSRTGADVEQLRFVVEGWVGIVAVLSAEVLSSAVL
jgi:hypothetical protein